MESIKVFDDLLMFNSYIGFINLSFNQYLLLGSEPLLVHTGSKDQAVEILPKIKALLGEKPLAYIFISHFESDECGGLSFLKEYYPNAKPVCSQVTARQLMGFGIATEIIEKAPGDALKTSDFTLKFIRYPSEMHLWEGLMAFEEKRGLLFSSDLFIRFGKLNEAIVNSNLDEEIKGIAPNKIPDPEELKATQNELIKLPIKFIVPGHGPCLRV
jgi:flavorubredoxin